MANYVLNEELRRLVVQVCNQHMSSFQPRPKRGRRVRSGGGSSPDAVQSLSSFGLVIQRAEAASYRSQDGTNIIGLNAGVRGSCRLMDSSAMTIFPVGDPNYEPIQFASIHNVPCEVGSIVKLTAKDPIRPGQLWTDNQIWGQLMWTVDELWGLPGRAAEKILWLPTGATKPTDMRWDGGAC